MIVNDILARNARIHPGRTAIAMGGDSVTYRELYSRVNRRAADLAEEGLGKGDRIAVMVRNSPLYAELFYSIAGIGAVALPLNEQLIAREIEAILRHAEARALIYSGEFGETAHLAGGRVPSLDCLLQVEEYADLDGQKGALPASGPGMAAIPAPSESDIALIVYTCGPAGRPLGAMLSHGNLLSASSSAALELGLSRSDVCLSCAPLPFMAGVGRLLPFHFTGGSVVILQDFEPGEVLRSVGLHRVTHALFSTSTMMRILDLPDPSAFDLTSLRMVLYGGTPASIDIKKRAARFFRCGLAQCYGPVESAGVLTFLHPEDHSPDESLESRRKLMSVGKEAMGVEVRIVDGAGRELPPHQVGEVAARGPNVFAGYFRDPAGTSAALRDGWLRTGDLAGADDEGYITIIDRKTDTLSVGGISVCPREIEDVIAEHKAVKEAAVIGAPDRLLGEVPVAVVELKEGEGADAPSILAHCRENLAPFKIPRSVEIVASLPRNSQGKVLKVKLREKALQGATPRKPPR